MEYQELLARVLYGAGSGIAWSLTGFAKSKGEKFDYFMFGRSVVLGGLIGVTSTFTGLPHEGMMGLLSNYGVVGLVENALKGLFRRIAPKNKLVTNNLLR